MERELMLWPPNASRAQKPQLFGCHWDILPFLPPFSLLISPVIGVFWAVKSTRNTLHCCFLTVTLNTAIIAKL